MLYRALQSTHALCFSLLLLLYGATAAAQNDSPAACATAKPNQLLVPQPLYLQDFETTLYNFLLRRHYADAGWCVDKSVRDTGPFVQGKYYAPHPAVRIYYSPRMMYWLTGDPAYWPEGQQPRRAPREGAVPDGAMIVKEMFTPPATLYQELKNDPKYRGNPEQYDAMISRLITAWTVMIKDSKGSKDGWFWSGPGAPAQGQSIEDAIAAQLDDYTHVLYSGFGLPCLRCHSSAEKDFTFSSLKNISGFYPGESPLQFRVDNSWRTAKHLQSYPLSLLADDPYAQQLFILPPSQRPWTPNDNSDFSALLKHHLAPPAPLSDDVSTTALAAVNPSFAATFPKIRAVNPDQVKRFPSQWADHVVPASHQESPYITSDNCLGCHGGLGGAPDGVTMFIQTGPNYGDGYNISEYGEWRWSPMGLAGRDPIFHAQLESEMALLEQNATQGGLLKGSLQDNQQQVTNTCLSCHGAMGQRQLQLDAVHNPQLDPNFKVDYFYLSTALRADQQTSADYAYHRYGELAREGISCTICHRIDAPDPQAVNRWDPPRGWVRQSASKELAYLLFHNSTGRFQRGPDNELFGPFDDVSTFPMHNALGATPTGNAFTRNSQMCGTCHTINLPNIGQTEDRFPVLTAAETNPALQPYYHSIEQATFLEWQNSAFAGDDFQSCQDCHMPRSFQSPGGSIEIDRLTTQIATIQDTTYPEVENIAPDEDIDVPPRDEYRRHEHVGLNMFLLEMFKQFPNILGVSEQDYMTSAKTGNELALQNMLRQGREDTLDIELQVAPLDGNTLNASVTLSNKTGHRFPSGVAFRRAFVELLVMDGPEVIWASGRTNDVGVIVDGTGQPLKTEFLPGPDSYQPHHQIITRQDQVQIYEELNQNVDHQFTTSFIHRVYAVKDNRLLPKGWRSSEHFKRQGQVMYQFMEATDPEHVAGDPDYQDQGTDFPGQDQLHYRITLPPGFNADDLNVKATVYYQAIPPYWLHQRFTLAPDGEATRRLYYLTSRLNLNGTVLEGWKLPLVSAQTAVSY